MCVWAVTTLNLLLKKHGARATASMKTVGKSFSQLFLMCTGMHCSPCAFLHTHKQHAPTHSHTQMLKPLATFADCNLMNRTQAACLAEASAMTLAHASHTHPGSSSTDSRFDSTVLNGTDCSSSSSDSIDSNNSSSLQESLVAYTRCALQGPYQVRIHFYLFCKKA